MSAVAVTADFYAIKVHIGDLLHVHVDRRRLLAVHAWCDHETSYSIEYVMTGGTLCTEYTNRERWVEILRQLEGWL